LPAPLNHAAVRGKIHRALSAAEGRDLSTSEKIDAFIDGELGFDIAGTYGGNTSCVEIDPGGDEYVICDLGSGVREFGNNFLIAPDPGKKKIFNIFISHPHWDHIMGFPFFVPAYIPGHTIRIHGCHQVLEECLRRQADDPGFPVNFDMLGADIEFATMEPGQRYDVAGLGVVALKQIHHGDSYGYRFEAGGKAVVYSTDSEHKLDSDEETKIFTDFFKSADLVIFDAMYALADAVSLKQDWGHSSNIVGVELCQRAGVKHYCMFHHEPVHGDTTLGNILAETIRYDEIIDEGEAGHEFKISTAYDGMEIQL
jgi:phosphoribosyl 1,2-cyclic phosphodiesterase|tara:strand:+ start:90 stop:1025 length:936 start_codon:yes stop_codon:yes gene_type:complete